jgi:hypothetical protein
MCHKGTTDHSCRVLAYDVLTRWDCHATESVFQVLWYSLGATTYANEWQCYLNSCFLVEASERRLCTIRTMHTKSYTKFYLPPTTKRIERFRWVYHWRSHAIHCQFLKFYLSIITFLMKCRTLFVEVFKKSLHGFSRWLPSVALLFDHDAVSLVALESSTMGRSHQYWISLTPCHRRPWPVSVRQAFNSLVVTLWLCHSCCFDPPKVLLNVDGT